MDERIHAIFTGTVQGIGFRYTAERIAHESGVLGWVRNMSNGSVEIVAEAPAETLNTFLDRLKDHFGGYIRTVSVTRDHPSGEFKDFDITY